MALCDGVLTCKGLSVIMDFLRWEITASKSILYVHALFVNVLRVLLYLNVRAGRDARATSSSSPNDLEDLTLWFK